MAQSKVLQLEGTKNNKKVSHKETRVLNTEGKPVSHTKLWVHQ